jgi:HlyD family secretion protein
MKKNISLYFVLCTLYFLTVACSNAPKVTYTTEAARKQNITSSITATGTIEPVTEVEVGTQVSGIIAHIYVDYNSVVHRGDVIAELDKTNLLSELASSQSNLANAQANLNYQSANYQRFKTLYDKGLISANEYEQARLTYEQARQQIVVQQQNVQKAKTNLGYATITAPIDGVVLAKKVEEGQTVASAMTTPTLFIIAQDLTDMRVIADIDEADIGGVKEGQRVTFTVDAYPEDVFNGNVTQVRQQATTESNVVTYEVVISARNDDLKLKPGLTANVTIYTAEKNDVLAVPAKALRFQPTEAMLADDETMENVDAPQKVWKQDGKVFRAIAVQTGMTNGTLTEITSGLKEGDEVITEFQIVGGEDEAGPQQQNNPFMPGPRNRNNQKSGTGNSNSNNKATK